MASHEMDGVMPVWCSVREYLGFEHDADDA